MNEDAIAIKSLLKRGYKQKIIAKILRIKKQKVSYWAIKEITDKQFRRKKLNDSYINKIIILAKNKTTSEMSSKKIPSIINNKLNKDNMIDSKGKILTISYKTVCRYLNEKIRPPIKIRKTFFLTKEQMQKRVEFCLKILNKGLKGE